ncbi:MAG: lipoyl domain-containing protein [Actinomycetota bacterium]|nr:lipoyl domain-containing protein [Actinomycetota bacterium]MDA8317690.1 lipoyl domain-containing protein [Actinomycetota bacterium]
MMDITFPQLSEAEPDKEGVVATWFVAEGETVTAGQLVAEVQMDKVSVEVYSPADGLVHLAVAEQVPVRQGQVIATVG